MSSNKSKPHIYLLPEDIANREIALGFRNHYSIADGRPLNVTPEIGGYLKVLEEFENTYIQTLQKNHLAHVIMLVDFDSKAPDRRALFENRIPNDVKSRVFVLGTAQDPEHLRKKLGKTFEQIGQALAHDCMNQKRDTWDHPDLIHNKDELQRLTQVIRPILFAIF